MADVSCPACGEALTGGQDRCPACGTALAAPTEGALAPDLMRPEPARDRLAPAPAFRKREPTWKDEVRERVRHRKRHRSDGADLPLFPEAGEAAGELPALRSPEPPSEAPAPAAVADFRLAYPTAEAAAVEESTAEVVDLPLHSQETENETDVGEPTLEAEAVPPGPRLIEFDDRPVDAPAAWMADDLGAAEATFEPKAVERPAYLLERVQAAAVDGLTMVVVAAVVVYFASRAARVPLSGLVVAWPYVAGFLAFFALVYAAFFTGLTGQTLGKMALRLRVVDRAGAPPGHVRAGLRAALGTLGSLALVGIAPVFLDPARRALHDRLLRTRVIRV